MDKQRKDNNDKVFYILLGIIILVRIFLITGMPKSLATYRHDDLYYAKAAHNIIHGKWLGEYSHLTIIKAPFYSLFMILSFFSGLSLNICETIFYVVACISLISALSPVIKNRWWQLFIFVFMCFVPSSLATAINIRVYREFVNFSLTLYIISFSTGLYLRFNSNIKTFSYF